MSPVFAFLASLSCGLLMGMLPMLWEGFVPALGERLAMPPEKLIGWQRWQLLLQVLLYLAVGSIIDHWGGKQILFIGILAAAAGLTLLGMADRPRVALGACLLFGAASVCVSLATLGLFFKTCSAVIGDVPYYLAFNLGFVLVGIGGLIALPLVRALAARFGVRYAAQGLGLALALPALLVGLTSRTYFAVGAMPEAGTLHTDHLCWWLLGALVIAYAPLEGFVTFWKERYLQDPEQSPLAGWWGFWLAFLGMRLVIGWQIPHNGEAWTLVFLAGIYAIVLGNLAGAYSNSGPLGLTLIGASFGPLLPTLLGIAPDLFPQSQSTTLGVMLALGALGQLTLRPLLRRTSQRYSALIAMRISMVLMILWGALALVLALVWPENGPPPQQ